jgi:hypothetical protein
MAEPVVPVVRRADYTISLEQDHETFVHVTIWRWSAQVARALRTDWDALFALHGGPIFATTERPHGGSFAKWRKFVVLMGFTFYATASVDGVRHSVYRRAQETDACSQRADNSRSISGR